MRSGRDGFAYSLGTFFVWKGAVFEKVEGLRDLDFSIENFGSIYEDFLRL